MSSIVTLNSNHLGVQYLRKKDKRMAKVIEMVGPVTYKPYEDCYAFLVSQIIGQMLSNKVADVLYSRLLALCSNSVTPHAVSELSDEELKSIGISKAKVGYIRALTSAVLIGALKFDLLPEKTDKEIIKILTGIHGIGKWSAKMYLIFVLDRQDVLPVEDGAFLQGYSWVYKTKDFNPKSIEKKCKKWKPYSSIAARFMYKALDQGLTKSEFHLFKEG